MKKLFLLFLSIILWTLVGCSTNDLGIKNEGKKQEASEKEVELTVSAAASLQDALNDIKANFEKEHPNVKVNFNFGASGALQQQISQGAPVDLFFSAAEDKFDKLVQDGLIEESEGTDLVGNELVLVVPNDSKKAIKAFEDLTQTDKISIGIPEAVPAGRYAKETLKKLNVWEAIQEKVVYAKDVRQVLTYIETNNVDAGIVYRTDAFLSKKVKVAAKTDENSHAPIIYPLGVIKNSSHPEEAQLFYDYLQNDYSMKTFKKYGFKGLNENGD
ncbi:molybdate ABC transporter substrate-binding protein [Fictibacillus phosphorivorans]|uniref:molybdate ABC transporter substrate-binding protein n=1 Tax=Fictibacillus phosphorivorans TaxID=1221500 RepID=UPI00203A9723|nr:molybdate ABC transporter substrate-binding protein [Fictibacillus phosphorivorans]MCM3719505.1 molybdate ABC transporter substrate-binding protein [Fictibacillus phosphorivorans]MCM3777196.1 molybdate ABC transporter substrate-binding protein [Fictibacillus phosphorivorans]